MTENRPTADGLAGLPRDYTGPVLGPALPGDLGRPIVSAQERGQPVAPPAIATPAVDPEEERRRAEEEAARLSNVFFQTGPRPQTAATTMPGLSALDLAGQGGQQDRRAAFLSGPVDRQTVAPDRVMPPASPYILQAGSVFPAALITGIRSDLPGQTTAQVTENVYDSPNGSLLLIPQGTRIIGQYDDGVTFGQRRVLLVQPPRQPVQRVRSHVAQEWLGRENACQHRSDAHRKLRVRITRHRSGPRNRAQLD